MATQKKRQARGLPKRTGKRKAKIAAYFEVVYPLRKLTRMYRAGSSIQDLRAWADAYRAPSGMSGNAALIRVGKAFDLNVSQIG